MESQVVTKQFKASGSVSGNTLSGVAAVMGNIDRGGDLILPGAFKGILSAFVKDGFVAVGHDWYSTPVAMPTKAKEVGVELQVEADFHSTEKAQAVKTTISERLEKGKSVGFSIGFKPDYSATRVFDDGPVLLETLSKEGIDVSEFDPSVKNYKKSIRVIPKILELYEWSIVTVPMNPKARAVALKDFQDFSIDELLNSLSFEEHSDSVLTAVKGYLNRVKDYSELREGKNRGFSEARKAEFQEVKNALEELLSFEVVAQKTDSDLSNALLKIRRESLEIDALAISTGVRK